MISIQLIFRERINERSVSVEAGEFIHQFLLLLLPLLLLPACQGLFVYVAA
jgi:hypothetical protein